MNKLEDYKNFKLKFQKKYYLIKYKNGMVLPRTIDGLPVQFEFVDTNNKGVNFGFEHITLEEAKKRSYDVELIDDNYLIENIDFTGEELIIPSKIDNIDVQLGNECMRSIKAKKVIIEEGIKSICDMTFKDADVEEVQLPKSVKKIERYAFQNSTLKKINLENVEKINSGAFHNSKIKEANLENLKELCDNAFYHCENLQDVKLSEDIDFLPEFSLSYTNIKEIDLKNVTDIGKDALSNTNLETVIGDNINIIGEKAFFNCENLSSINLSNVHRIKDEAFCHCKKLKDITINKDVTLWRNAFSETNINSLTFNKNLVCDMKAFFKAKINKITLNGSTKCSNEVFNRCIINDLIVNNKLLLINNSIDEVKINNLEIHGKLSINKKNANSINSEDVTINNFTQDRYPDLRINDLTTYDELLERNFSNIQISQILKAQQNNILISSISPHTPSNIIHSLIDLKEKDLELANEILKMCNKELMLEDEIEINKLITDFYIQEKDAKNNECPEH